MDISEILDEIRDQLEKSNTATEKREVVIELLKTLMTPSAGQAEALADTDTIQRLADVLLNKEDIVAAFQRQSAELDALKRITRNLTASLELQDVLDAIVHEAMRLVSSAQDAHIFLYDEGKLSFGAFLFRNGRMGKPFAEPRPEGVTYTVARQKETIIVEDMSNHPLFREKRSEWTGSIISIPLKMGEEVVGVMNLARSQTGPFSPSEIRLLTLLADQAAIAIHNASLHKVAKETALIDTLTGLPNRRALDEKLDTEVKRATRTGLPFAVVMMDLDGFKPINDTYGHNVGDNVLRQVAQTLKEALRTTDFLARYGGDELTLILPDTGWPEAKVVINKIQDQILHLVIRLQSGDAIQMGISGGVAIFPRHATTASNLLRSADEALYRAKRHQRGSFQLASRPTGHLPEGC